MGALFNVVFRGEVAPGRDMGSVKEAMSKRLKLDPKKMERLFSGKPAFLKKGVDLRKAQKVKKAMESLGAICHIQPVSDVTEKEPPTGAGSQGSYAAMPQAPPEPRGKGSNSKDVFVAGAGRMIVTNIETVPGRKVVEHFGLVSGSTIRAKHIGRDIMASLKNLVGGEIKSYTKLLQESRNQALERMIEQARQLGANAVVNVRFSTSSIAQGAAELYVYGTAVKVE
jgi:uncharacterized protein YbjQ (UPF0145 family)